MVATKISFMNGLANRRFCAQPVAPSSQRLEALWSNGALVTCTEWKRFMAPNFDQLEAALRHKLIFDGRNLYDTERVAERVPARRGWGRKGAPTAGA